MSGSKPNESSHASSTGCSGAVPRHVLWWVAGGLLLIGVAGFWLVRSHLLSVSGSAVAGGDAAPGAFERLVTVRPGPGSKKATPAPDSVPRGTETFAPRKLADAALAAVTTAATPFTRELIKSLHEVELGGGGITAVQAQQWKSNLWSLVQSGPTGVAAIREFMEQNTDYEFSVVKGGNQLGFPSLRMALIDALANIGGPEATALALHTLQSTAEPREIALLGRTLEQLAPGGDYRQAVVDAARNTLALAADGKLGGADVSPLFETFRHFGDPGVVSDIQTAAARWDYYAKIALAQLPDEAGVPALIAMASKPSGEAAGNPDFTYGILAQVAVNSPAAAAALLNQAHENRIPEGAWPSIASALSGLSLRFSDTALTPGLAQEQARWKTYHITTGNQNFYGVQVANQWSAEQVQQQVKLIEGLMAENSNQNAVAALQAARNTLSKLPSP